MDRKKQTAEILERLQKVYAGKPKTALNFSTPFELLVATILSAQTTDALVNKVTEKFFPKYSSAQDVANASAEELAEHLRPVNFFLTKSKNIKKAAQVIVETFGGNVPRTIRELTTLPGVGRKTANIVLSKAFNIDEGIAVDTHVARLAFRLGLTKHEDPAKIEQELMAITPREQWGEITRVLIYHGRAVCVARKPRHKECVLYDICPSRDI